MPRSSIIRLGWICLGLSASILALSFPLHCAGKAAAVAVGSGLAGALLGLALARITRTRNPVVIYFWLAFAAAMFWPLFNAWPAGDSADITPWRGAPDIVYNYFDLLRGGVYLLAIPFPFARYGQHAPDPMPPGASGV